MTDQPLNREQRRAAEHGKPDNPQDNLLPQSENNPAFSGSGGGPGDDSASYTGRPDQDVTRLTGAGTGGATEDRGRITNREDIHLGTQPNAGTSRAPDRK
jgi:hypothetical protein